MQPTTRRGWANAMIFCVKLLVTFGYFWLTIQNTANRHVSNAFDLLGVFISFPLQQPACPRHLMFGAISAVLRAQGHHHRGHVLSFHRAAIGLAVLLLPFRFENVSHWLGQDSRISYQLQLRFHCCRLLLFRCVCPHFPRFCAAAACCRLLLFRASFLLLGGCCCKRPE